MFPTITTRRWRERIVFWSFAILLVGGSFLYLLLIGRELFLSVLVAGAVLGLFAVAHYLVWGWWLQRNARLREEENRPSITS